MEMSKEVSRFKNGKEKEIFFILVLKNIPDILLFFSLFLFFFNNRSFTLLHQVQRSFIV